MKLIIKKIFRKLYVQETFLDNNFVFIHIPKNAGISVCELIGVKPHGHIPYRDYEYILKNKQIFYFAFVREPIDRFLSSYNFLMNGGRNKKDLKNKNKFNISKENFSNFINNIDKVDNLPVHFLPQVYFLKNAKGDIKVDNLGLVEDIEIEMSKLSKIVKFKIRDSLKILNTTSLENKISKNELDSNMLEKLSDFYREDIELYRALKKT